MSSKKPQPAKNKAAKTNLWDKNTNIKAQYTEEFSKSPWVQPAVEGAQKVKYTVTQMNASEDEEYAKQYLEKQKATQGRTSMENDDCSNIPNPCCPKKCVPQPKPKPKYKKKPIKPFATTDQLRDKIFGYIENQPNPTPLRPFRGYRDDIVRQQLCCTDDFVTNPPDPCPPDDPCEKWNDIIRTCNMKEKESVMCEVKKIKAKMPCGLSEEEELSFLPCMGASQNVICAYKDELEAAKKAKAACSCPPPPKTQPCPQPCGTSGQSASPCSGKSPCQTQNTSRCSKSKAAKKCKNTKCQKAEPIVAPNRNSSGSGELGNTVEYNAPYMDEPTDPYGEESGEMGGDVIGYYKKPIQAETKAMADDEVIVEEDEEEYGNSSPEYGNSSPEYGNSSPEYGNSSPEDGNSGPDNGEEYEPDPELRCEEPSDEVDDQLKYKDHPMFGGPDPPPKRTMKQEMKMYKDHVANIRKRYFGQMMKNIDDIEMITPDIAAAMVYSEELGMRMKSAPQTAYNYLYPELPSQPMLNIGQVTDAAPKGIDDIVVPLAPPMMLTATEYPGLEDPAMLDHPRILQVMPSMNLIEEPKASDTMPANDICELVTGTTQVNMTQLLFPEYFGMDTMEEEEVDDEAERFNIKLDPSIPPHFSQIQIRGTEPPTWFPGYYVALPSKPDVIIERKYGNILEQVWEEVQPEFVRPQGGAVVIGS